MDFEAAQVIGPQAPKFFCMPIRPFLCAYSAIRVLFCIIGFFQYPTIGTAVVFLIMALFDGLLFFGSYKLHQKYLDWSLKLTLVGIAAGILEFLTYPILVASSVAASDFPRSGNFGWHINVISYFVKYNQTPRQQALSGLTVGFMMQAYEILKLAAQLFEYFLINRLWEFTKGHGY